VEHVLSNKKRLPYWIYVKIIMINNNKFPHVPKDLLEALEWLFPDRVPSPEVCPKEAYGAAKVTRYLRAQFNKQNTHSNILEN